MREGERERQEILMRMTEWTDRKSLISRVAINHSSQISPEVCHHGHVVSQKH